MNRDAAYLLSEIKNKEEAETVAKYHLLRLETDKFHLQTELSQICLHKWRRISPIVNSKEFVCTICSEKAEFECSCPPCSCTPTVELTDSNKCLLELCRTVSEQAEKDAMSGYKREKSNLGFWLNVGLTRNLQDVLYLHYSQAYQNSRTRR